MQEEGDIRTSLYVDVLLQTIEQYYIFDLLYYCNSVHLIRGQFMPHWNHFRSVYNQDARKNIQVKPRDSYRTGHWTSDLHKGPVFFVDAQTCVGIAVILTTDLCVSVNWSF